MVHHTHGVIVRVALGYVQGSQVLRIGERKATVDVETFHEMLPSTQINLLPLFVCMAHITCNSPYTE